MIGEKTVSQNDCQAVVKTHEPGNFLERSMVLNKKSVPVQCHDPAQIPVIFMARLLTLSMKAYWIRHFLFFCFLAHGLLALSQRPEQILEFNVSEDLVMLKGFSPISYFEGKAEQGNPNFMASHEGVTYYFTSEEQLQTFQQTPEKYLPTFGGYCAYGVANGKHLDVDPENFKIYEGRLLLFLKTEAMDAREAWESGNEKRQWNDAKAMWEVLRLLPDQE